MLLHYQLSIINYPLRTLFLDLAGNPGLLALVMDKSVVASTVLDHRASDAVIVPAIETLLREAAWSYGDLTGVAAVTGPGGFMSLRVGISTANALSFGLKIPIAGVQLSDLWAHRTHRSSLTAHRLIWLHSTKKNLLFIRGFDSLAPLWPEATLISIEDAKKLIPAGTSFIGELIEDHRKALPQLQPLESITPTLDVLPSLLSTLNFQQTPLEPWYGREG